MSESLPDSRRRPNNSAPTASGWGTACWPRSIPTVGYPGQDTIPEQFRTSLDPFIALTVAATATTTVKLGSSVFVAPWYPPVQLARQLTSIDFEDLVGAAVWLYPQTEVFVDLHRARTRDDGDLRYGISETAVHNVDGRSAGEVPGRGGRVSRDHCGPGGRSRRLPQHLP